MGAVTEPSPSSSSSPFPPWVKGAMVVLVAIAIGGVYLVARLATNDSVNLADGAIERLIPAQNDKILQQGTIGLDLAEGYDAELAVNGTPIPDDEVTRTPALNLIEFQPGPGKVFEQWPAGQSCIVGTFWKTSVGRNQATSRSWCFTVL